MLFLGQLLDHVPPPYFVLETLLAASLDTIDPIDFAGVVLMRFSSDNQKGNSVKPASSCSSQRSWKGSAATQLFISHVGSLRPGHAFPVQLSQCSTFTPKCKWFPNTYGSKSFPKGRTNFVLKLGKTEQAEMNIPTFNFATVSCVLGTFHAQGLSFSTWHAVKAWKCGKCPEELGRCLEVCTRGRYTTSAPRQHAFAFYTISPAGRDSGCFQSSPIFTHLETVFRENGAELS